MFTVAVLDLILKCFGTSLTRNVYTVFDTLNRMLYIIQDMPRLMWHFGSDHYSSIFILLLSSEFSEEYYISWRS